MWPLSKLHQVGELAAAVAVVLSLIFVGYEVKQNSDRQRQATTQTVINAYSEAMQALTDTPEMACIYVRGIHDFASLTGAEQIKFSALAVRINRIYEDMYYLMRDGAIEPPIWQGFENAMREVMQLPGWRDWFDRRRHWYSADYQSFIIELASQSAAGSIQNWGSGDC